MRCVGEDQWVGIESGARVERGSIPDDEQFQRKSESIIRQKRRAEACSSEKKWIMGGMLLCERSEISFGGFPRSKSGVDR